MHETPGQDSIDDAPDATPRRLSRRVALGVAGIGGAVGVGFARIQGTSRNSGRIVISVWSWQSSAETRALADAAARFNASQDDIDVRVEHRPTAYSTFQLTNTIRNGLGPDVCIGARDLLAERDALGICEDITPYLGDAGVEIDLDRDFHPFAAQEVRTGERLVGIPLDTTVRVLMVNRSILVEEGVDDTEWKPDHGPVTFDRLAEVARPLDRKDAAGAFERIGFVPSFGEGSAYQYLHSWGARYFDDEQCHFAIDTPEALGAAQWVHDSVQHEGPQQVADLLQRGMANGAAPGTLFLNGEIVFAMARDRELNEIARARPDLDLGATFVPVPATSMPSRSWATGTALSLIAGARQPREAVRFLVYMAGEAVLSRYCLSIGSLSSQKNMTANLLQGLARPTFVTDTVLPGAIPSPQVPIATKFADLLGASWSDMMWGHTDVKAGLTELQSQADIELANAAFCS